MLHTLRQHWPEYVMEALLLGAFMLSASLFAVLLEHPASPLRDALSSGFARRALMGLAMGATALVLIRSRFGQRSGAHMNPSVTLTFLRLRKIARVDALFYVVAQFAGGLGGMLLADLVLHRYVADPAVHWVATRPGPLGLGPAFAGELAISCVLMLVVLLTTSHPRLARHTPLCAAALVALWITLEAPLSGMSMNPARSVASAALARDGAHLWVYFVAPLAGMLLAAELYPRLKGVRPVRCAKLDHDNRERCIFCGANS